MLRSTRVREGKYERDGEMWKEIREKKRKIRGGYEKIGGSTGRTRTGNIERSGKVQEVLEKIRYREV
jgi:hypothetical protein